MGLFGVVTILMILCHDVRGKHIESKVVIPGKLIRLVNIRKNCTLQLMDENYPLRYVG